MIMNKVLAVISLVMWVILILTTVIAINAMQFYPQLSKTIELIVGIAGVGITASMLYVCIRLWFKTSKNSLFEATLIILFLIFSWSGVIYLPVEGKEYQNQTNKYTIDRFEGDFAVLEREDCSTFTIPRKQLPEEANEGDVVTNQWQIDRSATELIKKHIAELLSRL